MMNAVIQSTWARLNSSPRPPLSATYMAGGEDAASIYGTMTFTPTSVVEDLFGRGEEVGGDGEGVEYFKDAPEKSYNHSMMESNETGYPAVMFGGNGNFMDEPTEYIFDRSDVRAIFLVLYTIVFCSCFFGNLMVILVVTLHWRMRSITNFCLANLAFADLCVGIFCVYQNIVTYLMDSWVFGEFMCKMYHFINSLSTTASVLILVVICIERYLAIIHPMTCKQMLTLNRLRVTIVFVWILSAAISSPRLYYISTFSMPIGNDKYEILCMPNRTKYNSKLMDMISLTVLFLIPLTIITILYTHIGIVLWKSSNNRMPAATPTPSGESSSSSGDYYRETDPNLIQTVNLTLLPLGSQQNLQQTNRPGILHVGSASPMTSGGANKRSGSFLPSPFVCLKCRDKSVKQKKHVKKQNHHHNCRAAQTPSLENVRARANCTRSLATDGNITNVRLGGGGQDFIMNCKACHQPYMHQPHLPLLQPPTMLDSASSCERVGELRCMQSCCHHHHITNENGPTISTNNAADADKISIKRTREDVPSSPIDGTATCCGRKARPKNICLKKQNSCDKSVTFSPSPPSPYCNRNCSCLDAKTSNTEPIVLVKFEKNKRQSSKKGNRKSQCTILMNTKSCHGTSSPAQCNGNRGICGGGGGGGGSSFEDTDGDSPRTMSPSPPKFDCALCHPASHECCDGENGASNDNRHGPVNAVVGNGALRGIQPSTLHGNFSFEHKRNLSVDSGISGMPASVARSTIEGSLCGGEQNIDFGSCTASCPNCGVSCIESVTHLRCAPQQNPRENFTTSLCSPPKHFASAKTTGTSHLAGVTTPSVPKRVKRMRIVRSSKYGSSALQSRRRIIRMLIVVVLAFAICHLPFHARKVWQYWSPTWAQYQGGSVFSTLFTPITFLIMYANSAINPILYAFMSKKFRMSFKDLLCCKMRHSLRISRNASVRSTHAVALSQAGL